MANSQKGKQKRAFWHNDGPEESDRSSLSILLEWLSSESNYQRWRGGNKHNAETKRAICIEILKFIKDAGIETERSPKDVHYKISTMEQKFQKAVDFLDRTGAGIQDKQTLKEAVQKFCPYYYKLEGVMNNQQSSHPLAEDHETSDSEKDDDYDNGEDSSGDQADAEALKDNEQTNAHDTAISQKQCSCSVSQSLSSKRSSISVPVKCLGVCKKEKQTDISVEANDMFILRREQFSFEQEYKKMQAQREEKQTESQVLLNNAMTKKTDAERELVSIEAKAALLLKRKQLSDAGVLGVDIDLLLPLPIQQL